MCVCDCQHLPPPTHLLKPSPRRAPAGRGQPWGCPPHVTALLPTCSSLVPVWTHGFLFSSGGAACSWGDCVGVCAAVACRAPESSCCTLCLPCHTACPLMSGAARAGSSSQGPILPGPCPPRGWGSQPRSGHSMGLAPEC